MRILHAPAQSPSLEQITQTLRERIRELEVRLQALERPMSVSALPAAIVPITEVIIDAEAFNKNLLAKMWKYLHDDERPAKAV